MITVELWSLKVAILYSGGLYYIFLPVLTQVNVGWWHIFFYLCVRMWMWAGGLYCIFLPVSTQVNVGWWPILYFSTCVYAGECGLVAWRSWDCGERVLHCLIRSKTRTHILVGTQLWKQHPVMLGLRQGPFRHCRPSALTFCSEMFWCVSVFAGDLSF